MSLRDDLLPLVDSIRGIPGELGLHRYQVYVRITTYSGTRVGLGTVTVTETQLLVGGQNPKVIQIKSQDTISGTSEMQSAVYEIGPLTPNFPGGGASSSTLSPEHTSTPTTVVYLLKGPGLPSEGLLCQLMRTDSDMSMHHTIRVQSMGRKRPAV